jgi:hypothetical protein
MSVSGRNVQPALSESSYQLPIETTRSPPGDALAIRIV